MEHQQTLWHPAFLTLCCVSHKFAGCTELFHALPPNPTFPTRSKDFRRATDLSRHWRILLEPISQLLNLSVHQSVDSLYLFLLVRRNWPLSFKLFNQISPSFIPPLPPLQPFSFALDCCEVLCFFFFETRLFIRHSCSTEPSKAWICCQEPFSLSVGLCFSLFLSGGMLGDE